MNSAWIWIDIAVLRATHNEQLSEHGGGTGTREEGLLESAVARARNLAAYGEPDCASLAAAYGFGIARNHPFVDGNKRTALVAIELFLLLNGWELQATDADCVMTILSLASGDLGEDQLADWVRAHAVKV